MSSEPRDCFEPVRPGAMTNAVLVLDTRGTNRRLGLRSYGEEERRLLFRSSNAHIEIRVPVMGEGGEEDPWLLGQYVPLRADEASTARGVRITLRDDSGHATTVETGPIGDFSMPCDPTRSYWLECVEPTGTPVRARIEV